MVIVNRFIQIVKMSLQISKLKKEVLALRPHFEAGVTQLAESLPSKQVVAGSSPVSRSIGIKRRLLTTCMSRGNRYRVKLV